MHSWLDSQLATIRVQGSESILDTRFHGSFATVLLFRQKPRKLTLFFITQQRTATVATTSTWTCHSSPQEGSIIFVTKTAQMTIRGLLLSRNSLQGGTLHRPSCTFFQCLSHKKDAFTTSMMLPNSPPLLRGDNLRQASPRALIRSQGSSNDPDDHSLDELKQQVSSTERCTILSHRQVIYCQQLSIGLSVETGEQQTWKHDEEWRYPG